MPTDVCRRVFEKGSLGSDLAVVEGTLEQPSATLACSDHDRPGGLRPIAQALNLPTVALVSCPRLEGMHLPSLPPGVDAILLDGLEEPSQFEAVSHAARLIYRKPVIGAVEALPEVREALLNSPPHALVAESLIQKLGESFLKFADLSVLEAVASSRPLPCDPLCDVACSGRRTRSFRVAYAQDDAFGAYFPDTLETLETLGADLVEFSPLKSETLPEADLVMIGCGFPDRFADALAGNLSLINAIRSHVYAGKRVYAEGGGAAYLGHTMIIEGREVSGVGILPFKAVLRPNPAPPAPVTCQLVCDSWLAPRQTEVRGYHSGRWDLIPTSENCGCGSDFGALSDSGGFYFHHHAVGSLVHLHLAALPQVVEAFVGPHRASLTTRQAGH